MEINGIFWSSPPLHRADMDSPILRPKDWLVDILHPFTLIRAEFTAAA
jgi:hypothetical protein